ncbi:MAG: xylose isomerase, partial [Planctomycetota bacterium]
MTLHRYFPEIKKPILFEGPDTKNPLAFRYYDAGRKVGGKTMARHLGFSVAYWHTLSATGADPFGAAAFDRPWQLGASAMEIAGKTLEAGFEFFQKLGVSRYCMHDRDLAPEGESPEETSRNLDGMIKNAKRMQRETGIRLLWGTANLFSHPRYTHGAFTNPDPLVAAHAAAQVRHALDMVMALGGMGYVFWGGREGYASLLNTDMKQEREQLASMYRLVLDHSKDVGFKGIFFIEPKPKEPAAHQYDFDAATTLGFLREFDLLDQFMLNIEANHAALATHSFTHELMTASVANKLGNVDINRGDPTLGWDTDQFPTDLQDAALAMCVILNQGGLKGGLNFDAKVRRGSFAPVDLFHAHIGGMDTFARGLLVAHRIRSDGVLDDLLRSRYAGYRSGMGKRIMGQKTTLADLERWAMEQGEP